MRKSLAIGCLSLVTCLLLVASLAFAQVKINTNIPGVSDKEENPCAIVFGFYKYAMMVGGILAFGAIVYGGVKYTFAAGNPGGQSEGKEWIKGALLGLLLLASAYLVLNTINPDIVKCTLSDLAVIPPAPTSTTPGTDACNDPPKLAQQHNNAIYTRQRAPELQTFMDCIATKLGKSMPGEGGSNSFYGSIFTYDHKYDLCNYTRGDTHCTSDCSHALSSCHYGGSDGKKGALAVDFGNENNADAIEKAAKDCDPGAYTLLHGTDLHLHASPSACAQN